MKLAVSECRVKVLAAKLRISYTTLLSLLLFEQKTAE